jgi:hypothetical protein
MHTIKTNENVPRCRTNVIETLWRQQCIRFKRKKAKAGLFNFTVERKLLMGYESTGTGEFNLKKM